MSNYTVVTNFGAKDGLASGNPAKLVLGSQFTTEFNNIATAIASKFDGTVVFAPNGNAAQPSYGFTSNAGTGMYNAAGVLGFATAGVQRVSISATGNLVVSAGNVTISSGTLSVTAAGGNSAINTAGPVSVGTGALQVTGSASSGFAATAGIEMFSNGSVGQVQSFNRGSSAFIPTQIAGSTVSLLYGASATTGLTLSSAGGLFTLTATGGDQGIGTLNATGLFVNGVAVGGATTTVKAVKAALTARPSTTTLSNDPDLVLAIPGAGTYAIEALVSVYNTSSATIGASYNLNYSGTFTAASSIMGVATGTTGPSGNALITATVTTSLVAGNCGVTSPSPLLVKATLVATGAGNLGFAWAQNNTNATATNVGAGSYITATKIA